MFCILTNCHLERYDNDLSKKFLYHPPNKIYNKQKVVVIKNQFQLNFLKKKSLKNVFTLPFLPILLLTKKKKLKCTYLL